MENLLCHNLQLLKADWKYQLGHVNGGGLVAKSCPTLAIPWTVACQAPLTMEFSRQEYWSG